MNYEILIYIGYIGGILGIFGSIYLFVKLNIKKAFLDLTGLSIKKELRELTKKNQKNTKTVSKKQGNISSDAMHDTVLLMNRQEKKTSRQEYREQSDTRLLAEDTYQETTILTCEGPLLKKKEKKSDVNIQEDFVIFTDITVVHTQEKI